MGSSALLKLGCNQLAALGFVKSTSGAHYQYWVYGAVVVGVGAGRIFVSVSDGTPSRLTNLSSELAIKRLLALKAQSDKVKLK